MVDFAALEVIDYLRSGALILAFFATVFADKKGESTVWLKTDALTGAAFGTGLYLFPNVLLAYQTTVKNDFLAEFMLRVIGVCCIANSLKFYYLANSKDRAVSTALMLGRVLGGIAITLIMMSTQRKNPKFFKDQFFTFGILASALWTLGNLYHLFSENNYGSVRRDGLHQGMTRHILLDLILNVPFCLYFVCFPEHVLPNLSKTEFHIFLVRISLVLFLTKFSFGRLAVFFGSEDDQKASFKGQLWFVLLYLPWAVLLNYHHGPVGSKYQMITSLCIFTVTFLNALKAVGCIKYSFGCSAVSKFLKGQ